MPVGEGLLVEVSVTEGVDVPDAVMLAVCVFDGECVDVGEAERVRDALALDEGEGVSVTEGDPDNEAVDVTEADCDRLDD